MGGRGREGERGSCDDNHLHLLLSEDVLIQILLWIPVISLLRFKSVCKSWRSIIQSPFFIHLHATTSKLGGGSSSFLFSRGEKHEKEGYRDHIFTLSGDELEVFEDLGKRPLVNLIGGFCMVGCCNGIICFHDYHTRNIALWNPAIKQFRTLPKPSNLLGDPNCYHKSHSGYSSTDLVMFGIDVKSQDYKVLLITTLYRDCTISSESDCDDDENMVPPHARRFHVYNLSSDSWRCIDATLSTEHPDLDLKIHNNVGKSLSLNGNNFFMAYYVTSKWWLILSFDFTEEIFRAIQPPDYWKTMNSRISVGFIPLGEKIALIDTKHSSDESPFECNIWVLNEQHGVKESSWTTVGIGHSYPYRSYNPLLCVTNTGQFGIVYHNGHGGLKTVPKLRVLNLDTGEQKDLQSDCKGWIKAHVGGVYKPSLVQIGTTDISIATEVTTVAIKRSIKRNANSREAFAEITPKSIDFSIPDVCDFKSFESNRFHLLSFLDS